MSEIMEMNYTELYGVRSDESNFSGAIERSLEEGMKHLDQNDFLEAIEEFKNERYKLI